MAGKEVFTDLTTGRERPKHRSVETQVAVWFEEKVSQPMLEKYTAWIQHRASVSLTNAHINIEDRGYEWTEDEAAEKLRKALASGNYPVNLIMEEAKRTARNHEVSRAFIGGDFVDILVNAKHLSKKKEQELRQSVMQKSMNIAVQQQLKL